MQNVIQNDLNGLIDVKNEDIAKILENMKNVCDIKVNGEFLISKGFFCKIQNYKIKKPLPLLIMNFSSLENNIIEIKLKNEKESRFIKIDLKRKIFLYTKINLAIIQILPEDNLDINSFLNIDDEDFIKADNNDNIKNIYLLNIHTYKLTKLKYKIFKNIHKSYECTIDSNSNNLYIDSPIINLNNHKVFGIYGKYNCDILSMEQIINYYINKDIIDDININNNEIRIRYNITNIQSHKDKLLLFGKKFVENNKSFCSINIFGKEQELQDFIFPYQY